jgi:hypothetical protein
MATDSASKPTHARLNDLWLLLIPLGGYEALVAFAPPADTPGVARLISFPAAVVAYLLGRLAARRFGARFRNKRQFQALVAIVGGALVFLVLSALGYLTILDEYTTNFYGTRMWVGSEPTPQGEDYFRRYPENRSRPEEVLKDFKGKPEHVWTVQSIRQRRWLLWPIFMALAFFVVFLIVLSVYAVGELGFRSGGGGQSGTSSNPTPPPARDGNGS